MLGWEAGSRGRGLSRAGSHSRGEVSLLATVRARDGLSSLVVVEAVRGGGGGHGHC